MINLKFFKDGHTMDLCFYQGGMITLFNEAGVSKQLTQEDVYEMLSAYFTARVNEAKR